MVVYSDELCHHGILGMKWGIRRYQNKDGTLTSAGKRRYNKMSDEELADSLQKDINLQRRKTDKLAIKGRPIGEYSKKAISEIESAKKKQVESKAFKQWSNKTATLIDKWEKGSIDDDTYFREEDKLKSFFDKHVYDAKLDSSSVMTEKGRKFVSEYVNSDYGRNLTMGYIRDLGFDEETAKKMTKRLTSSQKAFY